MLNSIMSIESRKFGVVETSEDGTFKPIVPLNYKNITFQKYGIIAYNWTNSCDLFMFDGTPIFTNSLNPIFLEDNLLLISSVTGKCFIIDYSTKKPINNKGFDSVLFFIGSNPQAIEYSSRLNITSFFKTVDYAQNGAHFEDLIAVKLNKKWGIIYRSNGATHTRFIYDFMVHCRGKQIAAKFAGKDQPLIPLSY